MTYTTRIAAAFLSLFTLACSLQAQVHLPVKKVLTLEAARTLASLASAEAVKNKWSMVIAVVDDGQYLGALGISGGSSEQDGLAAKAALDAFSAK